MGTVTIGVDIGQRVDPTAIAVVERVRRVGLDDRPEWHHVCRFLERLPLGTPYPAVAMRLAQVADGAGELARGYPHLYLDATGVGQPIVDVLREHRVRAWLHAVYFTHGDRRIQEHDGPITLGKAWLVSRMQVLLQQVRLHLPPGHPEAKALARELLDYEIRVDQNANDTYGAFKVGTHDDLVTALGLAVQEDGDDLAEAFARAMPSSGDARGRRLQPLRADQAAAERWGRLAPVPRW